MVHNAQIIRGVIFKGVSAMENKIITCRNGFSNEVDGRLISFRRKVQDMYEKSGFLRLYSRSLG